MGEGRKEEGIGLANAAGSAGDDDSSQARAEAGRLWSQSKGEGDDETRPGMTMMRPNGRMTEA